MTPRPRPPATAPHALHSPVRLAVAAIALAAAGAAAAQSSPWTLGISQAVSRDSNVLRLVDGEAPPPGASKSDTISTTALLAGFDQPIGRQRVFGNGTLRAQRFADNGLYDNEGWSLAGGLDWSTVGRVSGSVTAATNRNLASFDRDGLGLLRGRNLETTQALDTAVRVGLAGRWSAEATAHHRRVDYSAVEYETREFRQNGGSVGVRYKPGAATTFGAALRVARGSYPKFRRTATGYEEDRYDRQDLDFTALWNPGAASQLDARVSLGRTEYDRATQRDFRGVTGSLGWNWAPTAKLRFELRALRDTGQDSYFLNTRAGDDTVDYSRLTTAVRARATWDATAKITATAALGASRRSLAQTNTAGAAVRDTENGTDLTLGLRWTPLRSLQLGCQVARDVRRADGVLAGDVSGTVTSCFGQFVLNAPN